MIARKPTFLILPVSFLLLFSLSTLAQTQTTGRIAGTVRDPDGALIVGVKITVRSETTREERDSKTNNEGYYSVPLLPPGAYSVTVNARGFAIAVYQPVQVFITETTRIDSNPTLSGPDTVSVRIDPLLQTY